MVSSDVISRRVLIRSCVDLHLGALDGRLGDVEQLVERAEDRIHELGSGLLVLIVVVGGGAVDRKTTVHQLRLEAYFIVKQRLLFDGRVGIEDGTRKMWRASRLITLGDFRVERWEARRVGTRWDV